MISISMIRSHFQPFQIHPLTLGAIALILGICWAKAGFVWYIPALITLIITLILYIKKPQLNFILLFFGIVMSGTGLHFLHQQQKYQVFTLVHTGKKSLQAIVEDIQKTNNFYRYRTQICLTKIKDTQKTKWLNANARLWIYSRKKPSVQIADTITLEKINIKKPKKSSFYEYLIKEGISATIFLKNPDDIKVIHSPRYSIKRFIHQLKSRLISKISQKMNRETADLFSAMFLGKKNKTQTYDKSKDQFKIWGISHYLARSGLHLVIFIMIWHLILCLFPIPFRWKQSILIALALIYALLSWSSVSFIRALTVFMLYKIATIFEIQMHIVHSITLACLFTLLYNPAHLFFLDFQLSFALTFALAWLANSYNALKPIS